MHSRSESPSRQSHVSTIRDGSIASTARAPLPRDNRRHNDPPRTPPPRASRSNRAKGPAHTDQSTSPTTTASSPSSSSSLGNDSSVAHGFATDHQQTHTRVLSWYSVTRDSLVDNLLSSFDRMPGQDGTSPSILDTFPTTFEEFRSRLTATATPPRVNTRPSQRSRGHTYSSSLGTDATGTDESASYYSRNLSSRGKRSNSNSSYMGSPASIPRIRDGRPPLAARSSSQDTHAMTGAITVERHTSARHVAHTRGSINKGSKSSAGSSFDYGFGQVIDEDLLAARLDTRSPGRRGDHAQSAPDVSTASDSILARGRPVPSLFSAYEPGASHKDANASSQTTNSTLTSGARPRSRNGETWPADASQSIPQSIRDQATEFVRAINLGSSSVDMDQPAYAHPPAPAFAPASASAPTPATPAAAGSGGAGNQTYIAANDATVQQRPGFFRRVFGTTNRTSTTSSVLDFNKQLSREPSLTQDTPPPRIKTIPPPSHVASQARPASRPANKTTKSATATLPVVNKKASFFRRRKRSISEDNVPPPPSLPAHILGSPTSSVQQQQQQQLSPSSPSASSLRKILHPYLVDTDAQNPVTQHPSSRLAAENTDNETDSIDMFHSGYAPPSDATPRAMPPQASTASMTNKQSSDSQDTMSTPRPRSPSDLARVQSNDTQQDGLSPFFRYNSTFLSDTSDIEERSFSPSIISAISDTCDSRGGEAFSPVSPMGSPTTDLAPGPFFVLAPSAPHSEFGSVSTVSTGATIRPVDTNYGAGPSAEYRVTESKGLPADAGARYERLWLDATTPGTETDASNTSLPLERPDYSRKDSVPVVEVNGNQVRPSVDIARQLNEATNPEPSPEDMDRARKIYSGEEDFVTRLQAAAWLGEKTQISARTLTAYMSFFDWSNQNILSAMRSLCENLVLKGESQQVDRILEAFAERWNDSNPNNGFKGPGVVHNICYALLLLNTDQHVANIQHKMTRSEFIKNTMPAIKNSADGTIKPPKLPLRSAATWQESSNTSTPGSPTASCPQQEETEERTSSDFKRSMRRISLRPGLNRNETDPGPNADVNNYASNILINYSYEGSERGWLLEIETVLKSFYTSIVADALPLHVTSEKDGLGSPTNLSVHPSTLRRTGSVISKAPSEGFSYRGRKTSDTHSLAQRMHSKNRMRQRVYPASTVGSSRTSLEDGSSMMSPAGSSMWSRISTGKTQPSMSVESFALTNDYKQSLGFTNALSQAIIREEHEATPDSESFYRVGSLLEDESLELAGAPWAKEGMVKHKHHLEGPDRKAKERSWSECFAVVEKGYLHLFSFNQPTTKISSKFGTSTTRARRNTASAKTPNKTPSITPSVVGGGNWTDKAEELGQFLLRQTIATTLPAPGYSKSRPHVWALSLPTGAVHLFQVGTAEIAEEFASTANYWSARLSKEPLVGGVDNIEYGWSDNILNPALVNNLGPSPPGSRGGINHGPTHSTHNSVSTITNLPRPSTQSSVRTSYDQSFGNKPRLPGDRAVISDWRPPASSMLPSQLLEIDQLRSLRAYIMSVEAELQKHNELRNAIPFAYSTASSARFGKVMANWERKSSYLLKEVVKFRTYIEALERAGIRRDEVYRERKVREEENSARIPPLPALTVTVS